MSNRLLRGNDVDVEKSDKSELTAGYSNAIRYLTLVLGRRFPGRDVNEVAVGDYLFSLNGIAARDRLIMLKLAELVLPQLKRRYFAQMKKVYVKDKEGLTNLKKLKARFDGEKIFGLEDVDVKEELDFKLKAVIGEVRSYAVLSALDKEDWVVLMDEILAKVILGEFADESEEIGAVFARYFSSFDLGVQKKIVDSALKINGNFISELRRVKNEQFKKCLEEVVVQVDEKVLELLPFRVDEGDEEALFSAEKIDDLLRRNFGFRNLSLAFWGEATLINL